MSHVKMEKLKMRSFEQTNHLNLLKPWREVFPMALGCTVHRLPMDKGNFPMWTSQCTTLRLLQVWFCAATYTVYLNIKKPGCLCSTGVSSDFLVSNTLTKNIFFHLCFINLSPFHLGCLEPLQCFTVSLRLRFYVNLLLISPDCSLLFVLEADRMDKGLINFVPGDEGEEFLMLYISCRLSTCTSAESTARWVSPSSNTGAPFFPLF